jgi:pyruvate/oxaloacetate carboxyltransferase
MGWDIVADDVIDLVVPTLIKNGVRRLMVFDPLNDLRSTARTIRLANEFGIYIVGLLVYTISPVHTDQYYAAKAKEMLGLGVDAIEIKDPSGLLTPDRIRTLAPAMREAIGEGRDLHIHTHCTTGLGPLVYLEALALGVNVFHTAISPLAHGASQPPTELIVREARNQGFEAGLDDQKLAEMADYFRDLADEHNKPLGQPAGYDPDFYRHQVPGGMISNLGSQLGEIGMAGRLPEILEEIVRVREELGFPIMVSPLSQFVGVQALFNILHGERYMIVPEDIRKYVLGWYGELAAPVDPDVLDKITGGEEPIKDRPGAMLEPMVDRMREENGPFSSDEELILSIFYKKKILAEYYAMKGVKSPSSGGASPVATLIKELTARPEVEYFYVEKGDVKMEHIA